MHYVTRLSHTIILPHLDCNPEARFGDVVSLTASYDQVMTSHASLSAPELIVFVKRREFGPFGLFEPKFKVALQAVFFLVLLRLL